MPSCANECGKSECGGTAALLQPWYVDAQALMASDTSDVYPSWVQPSRFCNKKQSVGGQVAMAGRMPGRVRRWRRRRRTRQHDHLVIMAKSPQSLYFCRNFSVSFVREEKALALAQRLADVLTTATRHSWAVAVFRVQIDGWPAEGQHPRCMWACTLG